MTTGIAASRIGTSRSASSSSSRAGSISGEWNAPATCSGVARRTFCSCAASGTRAQASRSPERTIWPGPLMLATTSTPSPRAASAISRRGLEVGPEQAHHAGFHAVGGGLHRRPAALHEPERVGEGEAAGEVDGRVLAEREARRRPARPPAGPCSRSTATTATDVVKIAGWACVVSDQLLGGALEAEARESA